jgi:hypothetical protein
VAAAVVEQDVLQYLLELGDQVVEALAVKQQLLVVQRQLIQVQVVAAVVL